MAARVIFSQLYVAFAPSSTMACTDGPVPTSHNTLRHSSPRLRKASTLSRRSQSWRRQRFQNSKGISGFFMECEAATMRPKP